MLKKILLISCCIVALQLKAQLEPTAQNQNRYLDANTDTLSLAPNTTLENAIPWQSLPEIRNINKNTTVRDIQAEEPGGLPGRENITLRTTDQFSHVNPKQSVDAIQAIGSTTL